MFCFEGCAQFTLQDVAITLYKTLCNQNIIIQSNYEENMNSQNLILWYHEHILLQYNHLTPLHLLLINAKEASDSLNMIFLIADYVVCNLPLTNDTTSFLSQWICKSLLLFFEEYLRAWH